LAVHRTSFDVLVTLDGVRPISHCVAARTANNDNIKGRIAIALRQQHGAVLRCQTLPQNSNNFIRYSCTIHTRAAKWVKSKHQANAITIFTALHGMQTRSCDEISVRLSVRLSNACIVTKRKKS